MAKPPHPRGHPDLSSDGALHFRLFGGLRVTDRAGRTLALPSRRTRSLLGLLLTRHRQPVSRAGLTALFWPDEEEARARSKLSHTLWAAEQGLGPGAWRLSRRGDQVQFDLGPHDELDVAQLEDLLRADQAPPGEPLARLSAAVQLSQHEFMAGCDDGWALDERRRWDERRSRLLLDLATRRETAHDLPGALDAVQDLLRHDPLDEEAHRRAMQLYATLGQAGKALALYTELCARLEREFGATPSASTQALRGRLRLGAGIAERSGERRLAERWPLFGREREHAALLDRLQALAAGRGGVVLLEGEGGLGKTRLLDELAGSAARHGLTLLRLAAAEGAPPYASLVGLARQAGAGRRQALLQERLPASWQAELERLAPTPGAPPGRGNAPTPERMHAALGGALAELARAAPLLLLLDDLHWMDAASLAALPELARSLRALPALLVAAYRPEEARAQPGAQSALNALEALSGGLRLGLAPLRPGEADALAGAVLGAHGTDHRSEWQARVQQARGNPYLLIELLRADHNRERAPGQNALPGGVQQLLRARLRLLPGPAAQALAGLAVLGGRSSLGRLAQVIGTSLADAALGADQLEQRGLAHLDGEQLRAAHDLLREAAYTGLPDDRRCVLHGRAAAALSGAAEVSAADLARHFERAGLAEPARAQHLQAARAALAQGAHASALYHVERAQQLAGPETPGQVDLLRLRLTALRVLGPVPATLASLDALLAGPVDRAERLELLCERVRWSLRLGQVEPARVTAQAALSLASNPAEQSRALAALSLVADDIGDLDQAVQLRQQALTLLPEAVPSVQRADAQHLLGLALSDQRRLPDARRQFAVAARTHLALGEALKYGRALSGLGFVCLYAGRHRAAQGCFARVQALAAELGHRGMGLGATMNLALACREGGQSWRSQQLYREALAGHQMLGDRHSEQLCQANLALLLVGELADWEAAEPLIAGVLDHAEASGRPVLAALAHYAGAMILLQRGHVALAESQLARLQSSWGGEDALGLYIQVQRLEALVTLGAFEPAQALLRTAQPGARRLAEAALSEELGLAEVRLWLALAQPEAALRALNALPDLPAPAGLPHRRLWYRARLAGQLGHAAEARRCTDLAHQALRGRLAGWPDADIERACARIPELRELSAAWSDQHLRQARFRLPRAGAPTGRALHEHEHVELTWTLHHPDDDPHASKGEVRRRRLLRLLDEAQRSGAAPTVADLARALHASPVTVKRDLAKLRAGGGTPRTRGSRRAAGSLGSPAAGTAEN